MAKIDGLRPKNYSYLLDDGSEDKKAKGTKKCVMKRKLTFENYTNCSEVTQLENKINHLKKKKKKSEIDHIKKKNYKKLYKNNKSKLKTHKRFKSERHNVFMEDINKISISPKDDKRVQSVDSIETYAYGASKVIVSKKEEIRCSNSIKRYKMINFDDVTNENIKKKNANWPQIHDHSYRNLIIGGSGSRKTNSLFYLIYNPADIEKIYLYAKDLNEGKYQFSIKKT